MLLLLLFGLYFILIGFATTRLQVFHFIPKHITGEAAIIAGHANISTGIVIAAAAFADPLLLLGVAVAIFCAGVSLAFLHAHTQDSASRVRCAADERERRPA
jgi:hypothetical protein